MLQKITFTFLFLSSLFAIAQETSLTASDRPGTGDGPAVVPTKEVQLEMGLTYQDFENFRAYSIGEALIRVGLLDRLEGRIFLNSYNDLEFDDGYGISGFSDTGLGIKYGVVNNESVQFALLGGTSLPTGDNEFGSDDPHINLGFAFGKTFTDKISWGINGSWQDEDDNDFEVYVISTALAYALSDQTGLGFGYTRGFRDQAFDDNQQLEATITYIVAGNLQFDGQITKGIGSVFSEYFAIGAGIVYKF